MAPYSIQYSKQFIQVYVLQRIDEWKKIHIYHPAEYSAKVGNRSQYKTRYTEHSPSTWSSGFPMEKGEVEMKVSKNMEDTEERDPQISTKQSS